ncbi:hypothetical protein VUR80DRAFT_4303 [Thermomyces stellatus]
MAWWPYTCTCFTGILDSICIFPLWARDGRGGLAFASVLYNIGSTHGFSTLSVTSLLVLACVDPLIRPECFRWKENRSLVSARVRASASGVGTMRLSTRGFWVRHIRPRCAIGSEERGSQTNDGTRPPRSCLPSALLLSTPPRVLSPGENKVARCVRSCSSPSHDI